MSDALSPERIASVVQSCNNQLSGNVSCLFKGDSETILALIEERSRLLAVAQAAEETRIADGPDLHAALDAWKAGAK